MLSQKIDFNYLVEQVEMIEEMPVSPGPAWEDHPNPSLDDVKYMHKGTDDHIATIITAVKAFLAEHENSVFPGTYKEFRDKIAEIIKTTMGPDINRANAGYSSRMIDNFLRANNVIAVDNAKVSIAPKKKIDAELPPGEVSTDSGEGDEGEEEIESPSPVSKLPTPTDSIKLSSKYVVSPDLGDAEVSEDARKLHGILQTLNLIDTEVSGRDIIAAGRQYEMDYSAARAGAAELLDNGIIEDPSEAEGEDDFRDAFRDDDTDDTSAWDPYINRQAPPSISRELGDWNS